MKILISEDEEITLTSLEFRLNRIGFEVVTARDGEEALEKFGIHKPDLVIADISMPKMNGIDLVKNIRNQMNSEVPIIMITALDDEQLILKALSAGADDFLAKPFKPFELIVRLKRIFAEKNIAV